MKADYEQKNLRNLEGWATALAHILNVSLAIEQKILPRTPTKYRLWRNGVVVSKWVSVGSMHKSLVFMCGVLEGTIYE